MRPSTRMVVLGGRKLWTPGNISTALWLDANDASTITLNGSTVSEWRDKSGNAHHASQATVANQPTYSTSRINNRPAIFSDGINDLMTFSTAIIPNDFTIIAVGQGNASESSNFVINQFMLGSGRMQTWFVRSSNDVGLQLGDGNASGTTQFTIDANQIVQWSRVVNTGSVVFNGSLIGSTSLTETLQSVATTIFGRPSPLVLSKITIGELIIISGGVSTTDRQKLEGYLAHKWGLTANLPSDHPFKFTPPIA
jgi:hypothetical protein